MHATNYQHSISSYRHTSTSYLQIVLNHTTNLMYMQTCNLGMQFTVHDHGDMQVIL